MRSKPAESQRGDARQSRRRGRDHGRPVSPMLATLGTRGGRLGDEDDWAFEMKWDGIRAIATSRTGRLRLTQPQRHRPHRELPGTRRSSSTWPATDDAVLDGEIVALDQQRPPRLRAAADADEAHQAGRRRGAQKRAPVHFMALRPARAGRRRSLLAQPYDDRRDALSRMRRPTDTHASRCRPPSTATWQRGDRQQPQLGLEGVMAKRRDGTYRPGDARAPGSRSSTIAPRRS